MAINSLVHSDVSEAFLVSQQRYGAKSRRCEKQEKVIITRQRNKNWKQMSFKNPKKFSTFSGGVGNRNFRGEYPLASRPDLFSGGVFRTLILHVIKASPCRTNSLTPVKGQVWPRDITGGGGVKPPKNRLGRLTIISGRVLKCGDNAMHTLQIRLRELRMVGLVLTAMAKPTFVFMTNLWRIQWARRDQVAF
jgi:hypothetical protein